jgi:hypothetical protein
VIALIALIIIIIVGQAAQIVNREEINTGKEIRKPIARAMSKTWIDTERKDSHIKGSPGVPIGT